VIRVIFTLDYEINGNGEGCSRELMVEPTARLLRLFDEYGARLTIMADIGEILKFKEYAERRGKDDYHIAEIRDQLQEAVRTGHDVQLHIHSSYFNATHDGRRWIQDWSEYNFAGLSPRRMGEMVERGKSFLESILCPVRADYRCEVFRAANWSVSPSANVVSALVQNRIRIDTSVFKFGRRDGLVNFDYADAASNMTPWRADSGAIWKQNQQGPIWEVPIYSENRTLPAFLSMNRIYRVLETRRHRIPEDIGDEAKNGNGSAKRAKRRSIGQRLSTFAAKYAWKADFNQCTGRQLIGALERGAKNSNGNGHDLPFVLIGHSKLFTRWNEGTLRPFLAHVTKHNSRFSFGTFDSLALPD